jgi:hypothetical protein
MRDQIVIVHILRLFNNYRKFQTSLLKLPIDFFLFLPKLFFIVMKFRA